MVEFKARPVIPLSIDSNNWFSIHRNPGIDWEGRKKKEDRKHTIIEEFYDPVDSARALYRNFWSRNLRNKKGSYLRIGDLFDPKDAYGAYAKNPTAYFDTLEDFGYTKDSVIDLRNPESVEKFFNYIANIEIGRDFYKNQVPENKKKTSNSRGNCKRT